MIFPNHIFQQFSFNTLPVNTGGEIQNGIIVNCIGEALRRSLKLYQGQYISKDRLPQSQKQPQRLKSKSKEENINKNIENSQARKPHKKQSTELDHHRSSSRQAKKPQRYQQTLKVKTKTISKISSQQWKIEDRRTNERPLKRENKKKTHGSVFRIETIARKVDENSVRYPILGSLTAQKILNRRNRLIRRKIINNAHMQHANPITSS